MAHGIETKRALRGAYVHEMLNMEAAAEKVGVSLGTATRWKREAKADNDDWDKARGAAMLSAKGADAVSQVVLEKFVLLFQTILIELEQSVKDPLLKAEAMSRMSDSYYKTIAAARKGSPKVNRLALATDVMTILLEFVAAKFPQYAQNIIDITQPFGEYIAACINKSPESGGIVALPIEGVVGAERITGFSKQIAADIRAGLMGSE